MTEPLRIAVVTDIHYGPTPAGETKLGPQALQHLDHVVDQIAEFEPELVVELGDRVSDVSPQDDEARLEEIAQRFRRLGRPRQHLQGNHDIVHLDGRVTQRVLEGAVGSRSIDVRGWHLVFWDASPEYRGGLRLSADDLGWLRDDLVRTSLPAVVFTHVPLGGGSMVGNYYFEGRPEGRAEHHNAAEARAVLQEHGHVVLAVAGHVHWNSLNTVDGIHYVTIQSLTESFTTPPRAAAAWAELELGERIRVRVHGQDRLELVLTPRRSGVRWLPPKSRSSGRAS